MSNLEIMKVFTEEDKRFNRILIDSGRKCQLGLSNLDRRGGKMYINNPREDELLKNRDYDFTSSIIQEVRNKWRLPE